MGNLFDVILILTVVITIIVCFCKGVFRMLSPFRKILAISLAWMLKDCALMRNTVGKIINSDGIKNKIQSIVDGAFAEKISNATTAEGVEVSERFDGLFGFVGKMFGNIKEYCISLYEQQFGGDLSGQVEDFTSDVVTHITDSIVSFISSALSFIILYIVFSLALKILLKLLNGIFDDGVLGLVSRILGGCFGVVYGFLLAWIISIVLVLIIPVVSPITLDTILGGNLKTVEWFYTKFFLSQLIGMSI